MQSFAKFTFFEILQNRDSIGGKGLVVSLAVGVGLEFGSCWSMSAAIGREGEIGRKRRNVTQEENGGGKGKGHCVSLCGIGN